jgi:hypothetical protein
VKSRPALAAKLSKSTRITASAARKGETSGLPLMRCARLPREGLKAAAKAIHRPRHQRTVYLPSGRRLEASGIDKCDDRHRRLLRPRRQRPRGRCTAEKRYELATLHHSITSSARASSFSGSARPIAFAVLRLIKAMACPLCSTGITPLHHCRVGRGGAYALPLPARSNGSCFPQAAFLCGRHCGVEDRLRSSSANRRLQGILDAGAGSFAERTYPHFRHVRVAILSPRLLIVPPRLAPVRARGRPPPR